MTINISSGFIPAYTVDVPWTPFRSETIPAEMKMRPQWVAWRSEQRGTTVAKRPINARTGSPADVTDLSTLSPYEVSTAYAHPRGIGVGFAFTAGDGFAGVNIDDCVNPDTGLVESWAARIISYLDSYTEVSPSGRGVKIFLHGTLPPGGPRRKGRLEMYDRGRYFAVTGQHLLSTPLEVEERSEELMTLYREVFGETPVTAGRDDQLASASLSDDEVIAKAREAQNGSNFVRLWAGDISNYPSSSEADLALCSQLTFFAQDAEQVDRIYQRSGLVRDKWDREDYRRSTLNRALQREDHWRPATGSPSVPPATPQVSEESSEARIPRQRVRVCVDERDPAKLNEQVWTAVQQANKLPTLFRRGNQLCRLEAGGDSPAVRLLNPLLLRHELTHLLECFTRRATRGGQWHEEPTAPPSHLVTDLLATADPPLPVLDRVVAAPVFASDGSLLTTAGYHPPSRTYYAPAPGFVLRPVRDVLTRADIAEARALILEELLGDFPFVTAADRANGVTLLLVPYLRALVNGSIPAHLVEATRPGSGKGLFVDVCLMPSLGQPPSLTPPAENDAEWRKRITSSLQTSPIAVVIDNLRERLDSAALSAVLTSSIWEDRILGSSDTVRLPNSAIWVITANNPAMSSEIARRCIRIRLDPMVERPWLREGFRHKDLRAWVRAHRSELVWASLTLIRAWIAAGKPLGDHTLGSFERWAAVMGGVLNVSEIEGFLSGQHDFYEVADEDAVVWRHLVATWWDRYESQEVGTSDLFQIAVDIDGLDLGDGSDRSQRTRFGKLLGSRRDQVINGYRLLPGRKEHGARLWRLLPVNPASSQ